MQKRNWEPSDFGWWNKEGVKIYYKDSYELRELRPSVWLMRKRERLGSESRYVVKFLQYIPDWDYDLASKLLDIYLYPRS